MCQRPSWNPQFPVINNVQNILRQSLVLKPVIQGIWQWAIFITLVIVSTADYFFPRISGDFNFWLVAGQRVKFPFVVNFFTFFFIFTLGCLQDSEEKCYVAQEHKWFSSKIWYVKMIASDHHTVKLGVKLGYICDLRIINQGYWFYTKQIATDK